MIYYRPIYKDPEKRQNDETLILGQDCQETETEFVVIDENGKEIHFPKSDVESVITAGFPPFFGGEQSSS